MAFLSYAEMQPTAHSLRLLGLSPRAHQQVLLTGKESCVENGAQDTTFFLPLALLVSSLSHARGDSVRERV